MKIAFKGILKKTFLNFLVVALLPLLLLSAVVYKTFIEVNIKETRSALDNISRYAAHEIENSLNGHLVSIKTWASISIPKVALSFNRPEGATKFVDDLALLTKEYDLVYITDRDGKIFALNTRDVGGKLLRASGITGRSPGRSSCPKLREGEAGLCVGRLPGVLAELIGSREAIQLSSPLRDEEGVEIGGIHAVVAPSKLDAVLEEINDAYLAPAFPGSGIKLSGQKNGEILASASGLFYSDVSACYPVSVKGGAGRVSLELCCSLDKRGVLKTLNSFKKYFFIILFLTVVITALTALYFSRIIAIPVLKLEDKTKNLVLTDFLPSNDINTGDELEDLNKAFNAMMVQIRDYQFELVESTKNKVMIQVAAQVAHDIRSPLVALDAALKNTAELPEKKRIIVRHAVNRIRDIANNLLEKNQLQAGTAAAPIPAAGGHGAGEPPVVHLLSSLIDPVITEKRLSFESKPGINIDFKLTRESYGLFANIVPVEFRRMLSNLVNNAVEALGEKGAVDVHLAHEAKTIVLTVSDDGRGIPPEILAKLGRRGETHGKAAGSGLGLFHARSTAESWGGRLVITSAPGQGTTVTIKLPRAAAPPDFVPALELSPGRPVVVLDDDATIHQVWQGRFDSARVKEYDIEVIHFSEPYKLCAWIKASPTKAKSAICLFDYELLGFKETGLSLAEEFGLCNQTILVTSRCDEPRIIEECARLKIRMIPKGLADFVPILISSPAAAKPVAGLQAVLLDDDFLVHMNWKLAAKAAGAELKSFKTPQELIVAAETLPRDIPLYIDSDLGNGIKGEDIAKDLHEKGFTDITMATGHGAEKFSHLPWLQVTGKEPPWA